MSLIVNRNLRVGGVDYTAGQTVTFDATTEQLWIERGFARQGNPTVVAAAASANIDPATGRFRGITDPSAPNAVLLPQGESVTNQPTPLLFYNDPVLFNISGGSGAVGFAKATYNDSMLSPGAIQVTSRTDQAAGTTNLDKVGLNLYLSPSECLELHFYIPDVSKVGGIVLMFSNDNNAFNNYAQVPFKDSTTYKDFENGWNIIRFKVSDLLNAGKWFGSFSLANPIQTIRTQFTANTAGTTMVFDSLWRVNPGRPRIVPIFDDAFSTAYDYGNGYGFYTYLKSKGLKGTIAVIGSLVGTSGYMTHAQLKEVYDAGFDLIPHGVGYGSVNPNLMLLADTASRMTNIKQNQRFLLAMGFTRAADIFSFPQGKYDEALLSAMRDAGFKVARGTLEIIGADELASREYRMHVPGFDIGNRDGATINAYLDAVKAVGGTAWPYGHKIANAYSSQTTAQSDWMAFVNYGISQGFEWLTASQYRDNCNGSRVAAF